MGKQLSNLSKGDHVDCLHDIYSIWEQKVYELAYNNYTVPYPMVGGDDADADNLAISTSVGST